MSELRNLDQIEEQYLREHPEEIESYLRTTFEAYAEDGDDGSLLASLRVIGRVKGITATAEAAGMSRKGVQKALSEEGNPRFKNVTAIVRAMGYRLVPQPLESTRSEAST